MTTNLISNPSTDTPVDYSPGANLSNRLETLCNDHPCAQHPLFKRLEQVTLSSEQVARLLRNYDAHAGILRRFLLKAAAIMPEKACTFILENVRNEYGNGDPKDRHELQLLDLAHQSGVSDRQFYSAAIEDGVRSFIRQAVRFYYPIKHSWPGNYYRPAIAAGAITATEILAIKEFIALQKAFIRLGLGQHIWFNHVTTETQHGDESLALARDLLAHHNACPAVEAGLRGVLNANMDLI